MYAKYTSSRFGDDDVSLVHRYVVVAVIHPGFERKDPARPGRGKTGLDVLVRATVNTLGSI